MRARGWKVLFYGDPDTRMYREAAAYNVPGSPVKARLRSGDLVNAWRLACRLEKDKVRWLTVHQSHDLFLGTVARKLTGGVTKLVYSQHMHIGRNKKDLYHRWLYGQLDAFVTPVQWLADRVMEKTCIDPTRLHIIPRGIELSRYLDNFPDKKAARGRFNIPSEAIVIGVVGRLDPKKGQHVAIEALARLRRAGHPVHLMLVGAQTFAEGDAYAERVHSLVKELGLTEFVHFRPHDEEPQWAFAALDIFVLASKSECYGMVTIEALTCGLPVVATNDGGTVSLIESERNGLLVRPMDPDDLAKALTRLLEDPQLGIQLGSEARQRAVATFSHHDQCRAWEALLHDLART